MWKISLTLNEHKRNQNSLQKSQKILGTLM